MHASYACCVFQPAWFCLLLKAGCHAKAGWLPERGPWICLFLVNFFCSFSDVFCWFHAWNHWKRFEMNKKGWKRLKKVVQPAFGRVQHPKAEQNTQYMLLIWGIPCPGSWRWHFWKNRTNRPQGRDSENYFGRFSDIRQSNDFVPSRIQKKRPETALV